MGGGKYFQLLSINVVLRCCDILFSERKMIKRYLNFYSLCIPALIVYRKNNEDTYNPQY